MPTFRLIALLSFYGVSVVAQAHPGHDTPGFISGVLHPLLGLDHLLAMIGVGLLAAALRPAAPRASLLAPVLFVAAAAIGTALGAIGGLDARIEVVVAASLLPLGLALMLGRRIPLAASLLLSTLCGLVHGGAHGVELAAQNGMWTATGFLAGTALLHATGLALALALPLRRRPPALAACGLGLASAGLWLLA